jgi:6,7-dimethyl-8-ribityllumazine synthase
MALSAESSSIFDTTMLRELQSPRVAIISTEWNEAIVGKLHEGAMRVLEQHGAVICNDVKVPGAVELVYGCQLLTRAASAPEAIIAFGTVIRGGTPHFEYVCNSVTQGLTTLNAEGPVPVIFGVLTLNNEQEAWERVGGAHGHKGEEAGLAALKMIALRRQLINPALI